MNDQPATEFDNGFYCLCPICGQRNECLYLNKEDNYRIQWWPIAGKHCLHFVGLYSAGISGKHVMSFVK